MSRAIDFMLTEAEVTSRCQDAGVEISAIEPLPGGGTHLVCTTNSGADTLRGLHGGDILSGRQKRFPFFVPVLQRQ